MSRLILALLLSLVGSAHATSAPANFTLTNRYDINGFVPGFLIPFEIGGALAASSQVSTLSVTVDDTTTECMLMKDPYKPLILILKCSAATNATLHIQFMDSAGILYPLNYGPVHIIAPSGIKVGGGGTGGGTDLPGKAIFATNCARCHGDQGQGGPSAGSIIGSTVSDIVAARSSIDQMKNQTPIQNLSTTQLQQIVDYLNSL